MSDEEDQSNHRTSSQPVSKTQNQRALLGKRKTQGSEKHVKEMQTKRLKAEENSKSSNNEDTESELADNSESEGQEMEIDDKMGKTRQNKQK